MKTTARAQQLPRLSNGTSRTPVQPENDRASSFSFYFLMATLVLGLIYFVALAVWMAF